ncbi:MAG: HAD family hydrolase [Candidatus Bathyarchaeia archaeon]
MVDKPLLLFDMDGTLVIIRKDGDDSEIKLDGSKAKDEMKDIAVSFGVPDGVVSRLDRMAQIWNAARAYAEGDDFSEDEVRGLMEAINVPFQRHESEEHALTTLLPGAVETLEKLRREGYTMGLVTNASRIGYRRLAHNKQHRGFHRYFRHSITRDDCDYIKPEPEAINRILSRFNESRFIYIGDSDHDAEAAKAAGGGFILHNTRGYSEEEIRELEPDAVINSLIELPDILSNIAERAG